MPYNCVSHISLYIYTTCQKRKLARPRRIGKMIFLLHFGAHLVFDNF